MIQVRANCFETNSSSSHSLVVKPGFDYYTPEEIFAELQWKLKESVEEPGKYILEARSYYYEDGFNRWPFRVLDDFESKLWYLYAHAPVRHLKQKSKDGWDRWTTEYYKVTNFLKKELPWLKTVEFFGERPYSEATSFLGVLKHEGISWYQYLFNKNIIIICDGDEYCVWNKLKEQQLVKLPDGTKECIYD